MSSTFSLLLPREISDKTFFLQTPVHKRVANSLGKVWQKIPSREKFVRVKNGVLDCWRFVENIEHLAINIMKTEFFNKVFRATSNTDESVISSGIASGTTSKIAKLSQDLRTASRWASLFSITTTPFTAWNIGKKGVDIIRGGCSRFDNCMWIIADVGDILGNVSRFASGLAGLGVISAAYVTFAGPLNVVSSVLGVAGMVVNIRSFGQTILFSKKFNKACSLEKDGSISDENFVNAMQFLACNNPSDWKNKSKHLNLLGRHFNTNGYELDLKLEEIRKNPDGFSAYDKAKLIKTLRNRVKAKQFSNSLSLLCNVTNSAAIAVFLLAPVLYPPVVPLGFAFAATNCGSSVVRFAFDWVTEYRFDKTMKLFMERFKPAAFQPPASENSRAA